MTNKKRINRLEIIVDHLFRHLGFELKLDSTWEDYASGYLTKRYMSLDPTMKEQLNATLDYLGLTVAVEFSPTKIVVIENKK